MKPLQFDIINIFKLSIKLVLVNIPRNKMKQFSTDLEKCHYSKIFLRNSLFLELLLKEPDSEKLEK
jgi:hypothetical protein